MAENEHPLARDGRKDTEPVPTRQTPNTPRGQSAFDRGDSLAGRTVAGTKIDRRRADEQPAGAGQSHAPGEPLDKTLRHLDYRRAGGMPPTGPTYIGPITSPEPSARVPESERRDRR